MVAGGEAERRTEVVNSKSFISSCAPSLVSLPLPVVSPDPRRLFVTAPARAPLAALCAATKTFLNATPQKLTIKPNVMTCMNRPMTVMCLSNSDSRSGKATMATFR